MAAHRASPSRPQAVLFACGMNAVRSPMAAGLLAADVRQVASIVGSAGVQQGELDPFAVAVMDEIGIDISPPQADRPSRNSRIWKGSISI